MPEFTSEQKLLILSGLRLLRSELIDTYHYSQGEVESVQQQIDEVNSLIQLFGDDPF